MRVVRLVIVGLCALLASAVLAGTAYAAVPAPARSAGYDAYQRLCATEELAQQAVDDKHAEVTYAEDGPQDAACARKYGADWYAYWVSVPTGFDCGAGSFSGYDVYVWAEGEQWPDDVRDAFAESPCESTVTVDAVDTDSTITDAGSLPIAGSGQYVPCRDQTDDFTATVTVSTPFNSTDVTDNSFTQITHFCYDGTKVFGTGGPGSKPSVRTANESAHSGTFLRCKRPTFTDNGSDWVDTTQARFTERQAAAFECDGPAFGLGFDVRGATGGVTVNSNGWVIKKAVQQVNADGSGTFRYEG